MDRERMHPLHKRFLGGPEERSNRPGGRLSMTYACPKRQGKIKPKKIAVQCHRGIVLSLHAVSNDISFGIVLFIGKLTWSGSKLLISCAFLVTIDPLAASNTYIAYSVGWSCTIAIII